MIPMWDCFRNKRVGPLNQASSDETDLGKYRRFRIGFSGFSAETQLAVCACLTVGVYVLFTFFMNQGHVFPLVLDYMVSGKTLIGNSTLWLGLGLLMVLFWTGLNLLDHLPPSPWRARWVGLQVGVVLVCATLCYNFNSSDMSGYINYGWARAHYGLNPHVTVLIKQLPEFKHDSMFRVSNVDSKNVPSPYGVGFTHLSTLICALGQGQLITTWWLFKLVSAGFFLGVGGLIYRLAQLADTMSPIKAAYWFLANPFFILQGVCNGHQDHWMLFGVLCAVLAALRGRWFWVLPALVLAGSIKYLAWMAIPLAGLWVYKRAGGKVLLFSGLVAFGLLALMYVPFYQDWLMMVMVNRMNQFFVYGPPTTLIENALTEWVTFWPWIALLIPRVTAFFQGLGGLLVILVTGLGLWRLWKTPSESLTELPHVLSNWMTLHALPMVLITRYYWTWYLMMFLPLGFLLPSQHPWRRLAMVLSCTQAFTIPLSGAPADLVVLLILPVVITLWPRICPTPS